MKPEMTIAVYDGNRFFALGVQHILRASFAARGWAVNFVSAERCVVADLVVRDESHLAGVYPCRVSVGSPPVRTPIIVVRESAITRRRPQISCTSELGTVFRRDSPAVLNKFVDHLEIALGRAPAPALVCRHCWPQFTVRERAVLWGLVWGLNPASLANLLNMHVKTVSTHKRNAMRKLGFQRTNELYHWLRQGGLNDERGETL